MAGRPRDRDPAHRRGGARGGRDRSDHEDRDQDCQHQARQAEQRGHHSGARVHRRGRAGAGESPRGRVPGTGEVAPSPGRIVLLGSMVEAGLLVLAFAVGRLTGIPPLSHLRLDAPGLAAGLLAALPMVAALLWCLRTSWPPIVRLVERVQAEVAPLFRGIGPGGLALLAALAGLGEEALFRGVAQPWLAGMLSPWPAVALTGLAFGLLHPVSLAYSVLAGLAGAYFGALVVLSGNLLVPVVAHAGYDLVALLVLVRMKPIDTTVVVPQTPFSTTTTSFHRPFGGVMSTTATHAPGTFSWADLGTPDPAAAKRFYTGVFGWGFEDRPISGGEYYTIFDVGGKSVAALYSQMADQRAAGVPPHWLSYVSVESADRSAARAGELGGSVLAPAFDVMEAGRMAVIQDPTGGILAVWEPRAHPGAGLLGEAGALCWNELCTRDPGRAATFYGGLFGWVDEAMAMAGFEYTVFKRGDQPVGGAMPIQPEWGDMPPHWSVYFAVEDCDACATSAGRLGGTVIKAPADIPGVGRFAVLRDPQGAVFSVLQAAAATP